MRGGVEVKIFTNTIEPPSGVRSIKFRSIKTDLGASESTKFWSIARSRIETEWGASERTKLEGRDVGVEGRRRRWRGWSVGDRNCCKRSSVMR